MAMNKLSNLFPAHNSTKSVIKTFAEHAGLVYFGYVSQHSDEHHILRGITVSTKHRDDHYCIGTVDGYDIVFVERSDIISGKPHCWHVIEIDLRSSPPLPHFFLTAKHSPSGLRELLSLKHTTFTPVVTGIIEDFDPTFTEYFDILATPTHAVTVEALLKDVAPALVSHFKGLSVEVVGQSLYLYSEKTKLSDTLLTTMLENGVWLAKMLDTKSQP
jgi:hypothetical protein